MSSVRHNGAVNASDPSAALTGEAEGECDGFCGDLADGLHAMAQPLTILRSAIAMLSLSSEAAPSSHRCVEISVRQIDRVCGIFASVQDLVASRLEPAKLAPVDLQTLLTRIVEDQTPAYRELSVELVAAHPEALPAILGDSLRTEHAISSLLQTALSVSSPGDKVEISVFQSENFAEVVVTGAHSQSRRLNSGELLNLSVVKANILTQRGKYQFSEEPLQVVLALPICKPSRQSAETFSAAYTN